LDAFLEESYKDYDVIVYERYIVLAHKAEYHTGSDLEAAQAIGILTAFAKRHSIRVMPQMPAILPLAMKMVGMTKPRGHLRDDISAWLHLCWYLHKIGKYKSKLEREGL
jgi:hypothetical protein